MHPKQATILLVEDEFAIRSLLRVFLESMGFDVVEARGGHEGLQRYRALSIDAVILDLHTPEMNGLALIRAIRQHDSDATMIAMSVDAERLSLAHRAGARQTLKKPFNLDELRDMLAHVSRPHACHHEMVT